MSTENIAIQYAKLRVKYEQAKRNITALEAAIVQAGYADGDISGKNQSERDRAEALYLDNQRNTNERYNDALARHEDTKIKYYIAKNVFELSVAGLIGIEAVNFDEILGQ